MVMMDFPAASLTESWHERRGVPFRSMVQAPHCPSPQPYFVPVRPSSSRSAKSKVVSGSESNSRLFPFICAWIGPAIWSSKVALDQFLYFATSLHFSENEDKSSLVLMLAQFP